MKELFKSTYFIIGLILGIAFLVLLIQESITVGFKSDFVFYYGVVLFLTLTTVNEPKPFDFFLGFGVPYLILVLLLFAHVDSKNNSKKTTNKIDSNV